MKPPQIPYATAISARNIIARSISVWIVVSAEFADVPTIVTLSVQNVVAVDAASAEDAVEANHTRE